MVRVCVYVSKLGELRNHFSRVSVLSIQFGSEVVKDLDVSALHIHASMPSLYKYTCLCTYLGVYVYIRKEEMD